MSALASVCRHAVVAAIVAGALSCAGADTTNDTMLRVFYDTQVIVHVHGAVAAPHGGSTPFPCPPASHGWWSLYWPADGNGSTGDILAFHREYRVSPIVPAASPLSRVVLDRYAGTNGSSSWECWNYAACAVSGMFRRANNDANQLLLTFAQMTEYSGQKEDRPQGTTNLFRFWFEVDDYADLPADAGHVGQLVVQETWSETNGFIDAVLFASNSLPGGRADIVLPDDADVFNCVWSNQATIGPGVYCVETETVPAQGQLAEPIEITTYGNERGKYGDCLASTNDWNLHNDSGTRNQRRQRAYFVIEERKTGAFVRVARSLKAPYSPKPICARVRLFRARPVVMVHGISSNPTHALDPTTAFEDMRDSLPYMRSVMPCKTHDFPWNSENANPEGFISYVGKADDEQQTFRRYVLDRVVGLHAGFKANIICHSMGGFVVRFALDYTNCAAMINQVIFVNSPQYGSDLANFLYRRFDSGEMYNLLELYMKTSKANFTHLCRGSQTVWAMHHEKKLNIPASRIVCMIGTERELYNNLNIGLFGYDVVDGLNNDIKELFSGQDETVKALLRDRYLRGLQRSDGIVPVTSQNLKSLDPGISIVYAPKCHTYAQQITLENMGNCKELFDVIQARMNAQ